jgi:hypothetical protein
MTDSLVDLPDNYVSLTAPEKLDILWKVINISKTPVQPEAMWRELYKMVTFDWYTVFKHSDQRPMKDIRITNHVGAIAKVEYVPVANPKVQYTGYFQSGGEGLVRLSTIFPASLGGWITSSYISPSVAFKFPRNGIQSTGFPAMWKVGGMSGEGINFFKHPLSNHVPANDQSAFVKLIYKLTTNTKHEFYTKFINQTSLLDMAKSGVNGSPVEKADFPYAVIIQPNPILTEMLADNTNTNISEVITEKLQPGTEHYEQLHNKVFWRVYAVSGPDPTFAKESIFHIGDIILKSAFTTSTWGDMKLFFSMDRFEMDVKEKPEWESNLTPAFLEDDGVNEIYKNHIPPFEAPNTTR